MNDLSIQGQVIKRLYRGSQEDNWVLLETDKAIFELRLGGLNSTEEKRPQEFPIDLPVINKTIKIVKTDDFCYQRHTEIITETVVTN